MILEIRRAVHSGNPVKFGDIKPCHFMIYLGQLFIVSKYVHHMKNKDSNNSFRLIGEKKKNNPFPILRNMSNETNTPGPAIS